MDESSSPIAIVTDSSCDLPMQLIERLSIVVVPLVVQLGAESFLEGDLSAEAFWSKVERTQGSPKTSRGARGLLCCACSRRGLTG